MSQIFQQLFSQKFSNRGNLHRDRAPRGAGKRLERRVSGHRQAAVQRLLGRVSLWSAELPEVYINPAGIELQRQRYRG